jgi:hypothetical protein
MIAQPASGMTNAIRKGHSAYLHVGGVKVIAPGAGYGVCSSGFRRWAAGSARATRTEDNHHEA